VRFLLLALFISAPVWASNKVYVWKFSTQDSELSQYIDALTREFELALSQQNCLDLVTRRQLDRNLFHGQSEEGIQTISGINESVKSELKTQKANGVIFGEVINDKVSGHIRIQVVLESLSSDILGMSRALINKGKIFDAETRERHMFQMAKSLCEHIPNHSASSTKKNEALDEHQQSFRELTISIQECELLGDKIIVKFKALCEMDIQVAINAKDYRYNRSRIILNGEEIIAHKASFGADSSRVNSSALADFWARSDLVNGIHVNGTLEFHANRVNAEKIDLIEISGALKDIAHFLLRFKDIKIK